MAGVDDNVHLTKDFGVEIDGITIGRFEECEISDKEIGVIENRTGLDPNHMSLSEGIQKPQTITLGKVIRVGDSGVINQFEEWRQGGSSDKRGGAIDYRDKDGNVFHREVFADGFISKLTIPKANANTEDKAMFTVVISVPKTDSVPV